ncbi:MAG: V-type ATP synthase subunit I [Lentimicrobiaceae bacterium]|nr:V-type ATP synthase subunit I [Lentimicrobiaceae bacterium]
MKKYDFLIYHKDYQSFLLKLRELGIVHIVQKQSGAFAENDKLMEFMKLEKRYQEVIRTLNYINQEKKVKELKAVDKNAAGDKILEETEARLAEKDNLYLEKQGIQKEIARIAPLGNFEPENIARLAEKGWYMNTFVIAKSKFDEKWLEDYNAIILTQSGSQVYFATLTQNPGVPYIEAEHIRFSEKSISGWNNDVKKIETRNREIDSELAQIAQQEIETLRYHEKIVNDHINFEKVELSGDAAAGEKLMILEGYVPEENEPQTTDMLKNEAIYFNVSTPTPEDNPPIQLKNNRFARAFEMIGDLYDRPDYHSFDFTPFFAPFYAMFFGLCLGDCGYGLILLIASIILRRSKNGFMRGAGRLVTYLAIGTIIFGFLSGTFFGIPFLNDDGIANWSWLQPLRDRNLIFDSNQLFMFALAIGVVQIVYALIIKAITKWMRYGFFYSLDTFGWVITIVGNAAVYLMAENGTIDAVYQATAHKIVTAAGGFMMLFFNNPAKGLRGVPGSIGAGLFGLYNKISGIVGDVLSYIRLFALGISGAVLGLVFNQLAMNMAPDIIIARELVMILILLFGHSINIAINSLGAFIHPIRLTFVEFYNNVGFEGGGKAYEPFRKQIEN